MERSTANDTMITAAWDREWVGWHISWSAVVAGALAGLVAAVLFSFIATAVGAHKAVDARILKWADVGPTTIIFSVFGAFLASAIGGWVAARISGARRSEPAILQGVMAWLVSIAIVVFLAALAGGSGLLAGSFLGQLTPPGAPAAAPAAGAAAAVVDPNVAIAIRNAAIASVLGLLIGLMGSVVGGWMGSGERMHPYHYRTRHLNRATRTDARSSL